jgi:PleD family two-component response regulator
MVKLEHLRRASIRRKTFKVNQELSYSQSSRRSIKIDEQKDDIDIRMFLERSYHLPRQEVSSILKLVNMTPHISPRRTIKKVVINTEINQTSPCKCPNILICDDDMFNILTVSAMLDKIGYQCDDAINGA